MDVITSEEKLPLYQADDPDYDQETSNKSENKLLPFHHRHREELRRKSILVAISIGVFSISLLGAFFMGVLLAGKSNHVQAYCMFNY